MHPLKVNISSIALLLSFRNSLNDLLNQGQAGFCWCRSLSRLTVVKLRAPNINNNFISLDKQRKLPQLKDFHQKSFGDDENKVQIHFCLLVSPRASGKQGGQWQSESKYNIGGYYELHTTKLILND